MMTAFEDYMQRLGVVFGWEKYDKEQDKKKLKKVTKQNSKLDLEDDEEDGNQ